MKTEYLKDTWMEEGNDYSNFKLRIQMMDESTRILEINTSAVELLSVVPEASNSERTEFDVYNADQVCNHHLPNRAGLKTTSALEAGYTEEMVEELQTSTRLMIRYEGRKYFTSRGLCRDLAARAELAGMAVHTPTGARDAYIMSRYVCQPQNALAVVRVGDNPYTNKIFAMPSRGYCYVPQSFILELVDELQKELGEWVCDRWTVSHSLTTLRLLFVEKADDMAEMYRLSSLPIPGVLIETSDTGDSSCTVYGIWKTRGGSYIRAESYSRKHTGRFKVPDIVKGVTNKVFVNYTKLPERLCELALIDITDPHEAILEIMREIKAEAVIGKRRAAALTAALSGEYPPGTMCSGYDLAMTFLDLPSRCLFSGLEEVEGIRARESMEEMVYQVPFLNFEQFASDEEPVVVTPA